ncbi:xanthine dehydrogenase family protein molybdopterin-binding subunit [Chloroflexota bacterium]
MKEYSVIGKRLPYIDGPQKVTGQAQYTDDIVLPNTLIGKILRSPYPHARILNIDTSKAERLPGVKCVITGKDTAGITYGDLPGSHDEYPLAIGKVRYIGDAVAAVAAVDEDTAEDAIELIDVEYEELPAVFDAEEAMKDGAPQIHDKTTAPRMYDEKHNISWNPKSGQGDMEKGWAEADYIREDRFVCGKMAHAAMEPHSALSSFDSKGNLTHWSDCQIPFFIRYNLAKVLEIPEAKVRVIKPFVGGGFGGKAAMFAKDPAAALLSKLTGRPVRIAYTREECFIASISNYDMYIYIRTGVKKDGTITAQDVKIIFDNGAYNITSFNISRSGGSDSIFKTPCWSYEGIVVYTNKTPTGPRRGHTSPEKNYAQVTQLNMIAADLGLDPIEVLHKNLTYPGYVDTRGSKQGSSTLKECVDGVVQRSGWREKRGKMGPYRGIGIAVGRHGGGGGAGAGGNVPDKPIRAIIQVDSDGRFTLLTGETDIGQGSDSTMAQIAAEVIGVSQDDIMVYAADTALTPFDHGSFSSRVTFNVGNTVKEAAADTKRQLVKAIAKVTEVSEEEIEIRGGQVYVKGGAEPAMPFSNALRMIQRSAGLPIVGTFKYYPTEYFAGLPPVSSPAFYILAVEVEVDPETGKVRILRWTYANDHGTQLNPLRLEGQEDGCMQMGVGWALSEGYVLDEGQMLNASFLHYAFPTSVDTPEVIRVPSEVVGESRGPFGAKEGGQGGMEPTAAAIIDAIYDATGVWFKELSVTPEHILKALEEKRLRERKEG